ncbi:ABC-three component system middle component 6 [Nocardia coubleae]|uniref:ABC-three component system middle component 6 n=1 Tax=Nocardia coubleae TaxID=356147 RepID=UPI00350E4209
MSVDRALITIGADLLDELRDPMSVSALWDRYSRHQQATKNAARVTFDWFSLSLAALYAMGLIDTSPNGYLRRAHVPR